MEIKGDWNAHVEIYTCYAGKEDGLFSERKRSPDRIIEG